VADFAALRGLARRARDHHGGVGAAVAAGSAAAAGRPRPNAMPQPGRPHLDVYGRPAVPWRKWESSPSPPRHRARRDPGCRAQTMRRLRGGPAWKSRSHRCRPRTCCSRAARTTWRKRLSPAGRPGTPTSAALPLRWRALTAPRRVPLHAITAFPTYSGADSKELEELRQTRATLTQRLLDTTAAESQAHQRLADLNELLRRKNDECKRRADRCGRAPAWAARRVLTACAGRIAVTWATCVAQRHQAL